MQKSSVHTLPDSHQSLWQIASIQIAGWTSLPILATSIVILQVNSFLGSVLTIIFGNAILWFIRVGIIAMGHVKKQSTMDIARDYLGKSGSYFIAMLLLLSTLCWFIAQTTTGSNSITHLLHIEENAQINQFMQVSVLLGTLSTLFCMGGMILLRKLSTIALPFLAVAFIMILYVLPDKSLVHSGKALSLAGLTMVLTTNLGVTADLPTFFRHSKSWKTSIQALTLVQVVSTLIGICGLYFGSLITNGLEINQASTLLTTNMALKIPLICFIFLSVICTNVANVYSASVGWELVAPKTVVGRKEYFILGLGLTTIFILVAGLFPIELFLKVFESSLVNLCAILVIGYIIKERRKQLPGQFQQTSYFVAWFISSIINTLQYSNVLLGHNSVIFVSCIVIVLTLLPSLLISHTR